MLPGIPGVRIIATEIAGGKIQFTADVVDSNLSDGDLRALFFHINEAKLAGMAVTSADPLLTESRIGLNNVLDLGDGATLAGAVKKGFDVGTEWGTPGGKYDNIDFPVTFTISNAAGNLNLDDIGGQLFGAKLDSVGGRGGPSGSSAKLTALAPWAPDAVDDVKNIYEDNAPDANTPSKSPTAVVIDVLANDTDHDTPSSFWSIDHIIDGAGPSHGTVAIVDNKIQYTPDLDFAGTDSFWYCMTDGNGGQDSAQVTVNITAVADDPLITFNVAQGATINDTLVTVTATQNDADGSEDISSLVWAIAGGTPAGVTVTPVGSISGSGNQLIQQFTVTTAPGMDWSFDINFTATSREDTSPFDTESQTAAQHIEIDYTHNETALTFGTTNQSIWGTGSGQPFDYNPFLGLQNVPLDFDPPLIPVSILPPAAIDIETTGSLTFGLDTVIHLDAGHISADLNVTTTINTIYNKTTDTLLVNSSYSLNGGSIHATGPNGSFDVDFVLDVSGSWHVSLEPLDFLTGWANIGDTFNEHVREDVYNADTASLSNTWPIWPGVIDFTLSFPDTSINTASLSGSATDHIIDLDIDVDAAAIQFFPLLAPLDPVPGSDDDLELLAVNLHGFLDLIQTLTVNLNQLGGSLALEDGTAPMAFNFGDSLPFITHASSHDQDGDGRVEFNITVDPDVSLTSDASLGFAIGASVYLLRGLPFDLDPIKLFDDTLPIADFSVFNQTFALEGFANQDWGLFA
jgi:hypothetical protein